MMQSTGHTGFSYWLEGLVRNNAQYLENRGITAHYYALNPPISRKSQCGQLIASFRRFRGLEWIFVLFVSCRGKKSLLQLGLAGLTPREAARGAMYRPEFQKMPDPLSKVLPDPLAGVKKEDMFMVVSTVCYRWNLMFYSMSKQSIQCLNSVHLILASRSGSRQGVVRIGRGSRIGCH